LAVLLLLAPDVAGRLGCSRDRVMSGQAEFGGPALDVGPEPVSFVEVTFGGGVGCYPPLMVSSGGRVRAFGGGRG
jgi:hypothetical protein